MPYVTSLSIMQRHSSERGEGLCRHPSHLGDLGRADLQHTRRLAHAAPCIERGTYATDLVWRRPRAPKTLARCLGAFQTCHYPVSDHRPLKLAEYAQHAEQGSSGWC